MPHSLKDANIPNVLIVISTGIVGGPGKGILQLTGELHKEESVQYTIGALRVKNQSSHQFIETASENGRNIEIIEQDSSFDLSALKQLSSIIARRNINIIQTHGYKEHLLGLLLKRKHPQLKWVALAHGWTAENLKMKLYHLLDTFTLRFPDTLITVSEAMMGQFGAYRKNKHCAVISNAVESKDLPDQIRENSTPEDYYTNENFIWGSFGRLTKDKGHDILINAFKKSLEHNPSQRLIIVGDGPERDNLQHLVDNLGLTKVVHLAGYQTDIESYYRLIQAFVLPSVAFEGLPNVLLEALSYEIPVISTPVAGVTELVKDGLNGWIVPIGDIEALTRKMNDILDTPDAYSKIKANTRSSLYPTYSVSRRVNQFISEYNRLLSNGH